MVIPIHFYKVRSRFGLIHLPYKHQEMNFGVEKGSDAILSDNFLSQYKSYAIDAFDFPMYESIEKTHYRELLKIELEECSDLISRTIKDNEMQIVVGGDHSVTFSSVRAVLHRFKPQEIGYLQFDSQGDMHTFSSSPSGNFHGMFARALVDTFDDEGINALCPKKIPLKNVLFFGNLDLEHAEIEFFNKNQIKNIVKRDMVECKEDTLQMISQFIASFAHVHVTFDVDVCDKAIVTATGTPAPDGWSKEALFQVLQVIRNHKSISLDVVEVNPLKPHPDKTIRFAQEVIVNITKK